MPKQLRFLRGIRFVQRILRVRLTILADQSIQQPKLSMKTFASTKASCRSVEVTRELATKLSANTYFTPRLPPPQPLRPPSLTNTNLVESDNKNGCCCCLKSLPPVANNQRGNPLDSSPLPPPLLTPLCQQQQLTPLA